MEKFDFALDMEEKNLIIKKLEKIQKLIFKRKKIKDIIQNKETEPFVIELCGLPKTGKTSCINIIRYFFENQKISVEVIDNRISIYERLRNIDSLKFNDNIIELSKQKLKLIKRKNPNIIIMENGIIDSYFFYQRLYDNKKISEIEFKEKIKKLTDDFKDIDQLYIMNASLNEVYKRDNKVVLDFLINKKEDIDRFFYILISIDGTKIFEINTDSIDEKYTSLILIDSITNEILKKLNKNSKSSSEEFMDSYICKDEKELEKHKEKLDSDNMKLIMKKD